MIQYHLLCENPDGTTVYQPVREFCPKSVDKETQRTEYLALIEKQTAEWIAEGSFKSVKLLIDTTFLEKWIYSKEAGEELYGHLLAKAQ